MCDSGDLSSVPESLKAGPPGSDGCDAFNPSLVYRVSMLHTERNLVSKNKKPNFMAGICNPSEMGGRGSINWKHSYPEIREILPQKQDGRQAPTTEVVL